MDTRAAWIQIRKIVQKYRQRQTRCIWQKSENKRKLNKFSQGLFLEGHYENKKGMNSNIVI